MTDALDPYNLRRFTQAQDPVFERVCEELRAGRKASHWMWFIFPQIKGLGHSATAARFAIGCLAEARAYAAHAVLGPRLTLTTQLVNAVAGASLREILGAPDDLKFRSCMTLFALAWPGNGVFSEALDRYFDGLPDPLSVELLSRENPRGPPAPH
jgi:uncharacterized protein (DUF1810 family)